MNEIMVKDDVKIENMIFEVRGKQVMPDSEIASTKCHYSFFNKITIYNDISKKIFVFNNFIMGGKIIWN